MTRLSQIRKFRKFQSHQSKQQRLNKFLKSRSNNPFRPLQEDPEIEKNKGESVKITSEPPPLKQKFFLQLEDLQKQLEDAQNRVLTLIGNQNQNIKKRLMHEISQMKRALLQPELYVVDPDLERQKREEDKNKRIQQKLQKKQDAVKQLKKEQQRQSKHRCLSCREIGHLISECPQITQKVNGFEATTQICYNCGSLEHTLQDCRAPQSGDALEFAICFVCQQKGHISRDCPENQRGIFIKGGSCYICNSVRHTKQDCPQNPENVLNQRRRLKRDGLYEEQEQENWGGQQKNYNSSNDNQNQPHPYYWKPKQKKAPTELNPEF